jgi:hypothetical protein
MVVRLTLRTFPPTRTQVIRRQVDLKSQCASSSTTGRLREEQTQGSHECDDCGGSGSAPRFLGLGLGKVKQRLHKE